MSDLIIENAENIDSQVSLKMKKPTKGVGKSSGKTSGRVTLNEIAINSLRSQGSLRQGKDFVIYQDPVTATTTKKLESSSVTDQEVQCEAIEMTDSEVQTRLSGKYMEAAEAEAFMYSETEDETYWKELAEKRLEALNESLNENEGLHIENADLHYQVTSLQESLKAAEEIVGEMKSLVMESKEET
ncbi:uncharacterized protein geminin [Lepeophtheirus salmonis]|uniref:uncharacterized protein geminin n=1 Tax=Lepeophtheirus salmonis TaxID=72036 RepID=UPI001AE2133A|nr:geminin-like [Lepeophtheirus salmonis]